MLTDTGSAAPAPAPSATTSTADLSCPMCDYNLHGLAEPRCPECGFTFAWRDLVDPTRRKHKYLFEHHPNRSVWSFFRTALGGLLPWRFWRSLRPEQPSDVRRLIKYWLITALGVVMLPMCIYGLLCIVFASHTTRIRAGMIAQLNAPGAEQNSKWAAQRYGSVEAYLDQFAPVPASGAFFGHVWGQLYDHSVFTLIVLGMAAFLALPWLTALSLMLFQATMRRARVRGAHVLRCCLYSFDGGWWFGLVCALAFTAAAIDALLEPNRLRLAPIVPIVLGAGSIALVGGGMVKLLLAYRMYMRFPHAITTVLLALTVTFLLIATVALNLPGVPLDLLIAWRSM